MLKLESLPRIMFKFLPRLVLASSLGVQGGMAWASGQLESYRALSGYFDELSAAASMAPLMEYFGVTESESLPPLALDCKEGSHREAYVAATAWIQDVEVELNQSLENRFSMTHKVKAELSQWIGKDHYHICYGSWSQDRSLSQYMILRSPAKLPFVFEVGFEE